MTPRCLSSRFIVQIFLSELNNLVTVSRHNRKKKRFFSVTAKKDVLKNLQIDYAYILSKETWQEIRLEKL